MTDQATSQANPAPKAALPVFYRQPELLSSERHARKSLAPSADHRFAKDTNAVPLNGVELELAQRHYPIVFSDEATPFPMAILGLRTSENLFLDPSGRWTEGIYVPAYVRRYPFVFMTAPDQKQFALCIDAASGLVVDGDSNPFFRDGQPTELTKNALGFCTSFQAEYEKTRAFTAALAEHKLLESRSANIELGNGQKLVFGPFRAIDAAKLAALPNAVIAEWLRSGWLGWIYAHLMSAPNWAALASRLKAPA
ncbi:MAG: SapC family protein [Candidatus Odyssella sp.]|nr:SapC family protein [Candidatus Odyssella sp.]